MLTEPIISGKYFILESDNRFPLSIPNGEWQNFTNKNFICPTGCSIYLLSGHNNLYVGSDGDGDRIYDHKKEFKGGYHRNPYMQNVVNKYSLEIFYYQPLVEIPPDYVQYRDQIENSYIKLFDTFHNGYNLCEFANTPMLGRKHTIETLQKMSQSHKNMSLETREKMRNAMLGEKNHFYRKTHSKETRNKLSEWAINQGCRPPSRKGKSPANRRKVICIETGKIYDSIENASNDSKVSRCNISSVCIGSRKLAGGFHWKYTD